MGKKSFQKYDLENEEAFKRYLQAIGANIFDINDEIKEME